LDLIVQTAQNSALGIRVIVLNEFFRDADLRGSSLAITLEKEPAIILKHRGLDHQCSREGSFQNFHRGRSVRLRVLSAFAAAIFRSVYFPSRPCRFGPVPQ